MSSGSVEKHVGVKVFATIVYIFALPVLLFTALGMLLPAVFLFEELRKPEADMVSGIIMLFFMLLAVSAPIFSTVSLILIWKKSLWWCLLGIPTVLFAVYMVFSLFGTF